jgi:hypothetical protein
MTSGWRQPGKGGFGHWPSPLPGERGRHGLLADELTYAGLVEPVRSGWLCRQKPTSPQLCVDDCSVLPSTGVLIGAALSVWENRWYPFRPVVHAGLEVDAPVSVIMAGMPGDP